MDSEETKRLIAEERKRIEEERLEEKREERKRTLIVIASLIVIGSIIFLILFKLILPFFDNNDEEQVGQIIATPNISNTSVDNSSNISAAEQAIILEEERLKELKNKCISIFEKSMNDYDYYIFKTKDSASNWIDEETKEREEYGTFDERVDYQLRYGFTVSKITIAETVPLIIAMGNIESININESEGIVCNHDGLVDIVGDSRANLLYGITMRREWV